MEITVEQRKQLLAYLSTRSYAEVFQMVAMLVSLKPKTNGKMEIAVEQRKQLLEYLSRRPYAEVFQLVAMLIALKPKTNGKDKDKVTPKN